MVLARLLSFDREDELLLGAAGRPAVPLHRAVLLTGLGEGALGWLRRELSAGAQSVSGARPGEGQRTPPVGGTGGGPAEGQPTLHGGGAGARAGTAVLSGSRRALAGLALRAREAGEAALSRALGRLDHYDAPPAPLTLGGRRFDWGVRTYVMGIVNVTPDSFSDGGRTLDAAAAIAHGVRLAEAGADLLDVGGESTRPGAAAVSEDEELRRVLPVVEGLARAVPGVPLSIDTSKAEVARRAVAAGAALVNDVTGFRDEALVKAVAASGAAACLMHMQGTPRTMQEAPAYDDVVEEVLSALEAGVDRAVALGVPRERLLVDPGIGFGKTAAHNLFLLRRLADLRLLGLPVLVGTSRKSFLGALTGGKPPEARAVASAASAAIVAVLRGADVVRVHDVAETRDALAVADAVRAAADGGRALQR